MNRKGKCRKVHVDFTRTFSFRILEKKKKKKKTIEERETEGGGEGRRRGLKRRIPPASIEYQSIEKKAPCIVIT